MLNTTTFVQPTPLHNFSPTRRRCRSTIQSSLPSSAYTTLQDNTPLCRLITGIRLSESPDPTITTRAIHTLAVAGFQTFDMPTTTASTIIEHPTRAYIRLAGRAAASSLQVCARFTVPPTSSTVRRPAKKAVDNALHTMGVERLHLANISCGGECDARCVDFLGELEELCHIGKVRSVGGLNLRTRDLQFLESQGLGVSSNTVPFSLIDIRPIIEMVDWCRERDVGLVASSPLAGGFFSEKYLGLPEPSKKACATPSLLRFAAVIRLWGGWSLFQELLYALKLVSERHEVQIPHIALKWLLEHPTLAAVVVGSRLVTANEIERLVGNSRTFDFQLEEEDLAILNRVAKQGNDLFRILGDSGNEFVPKR